MSSGEGVQLASRQCDCQGSYRLSTAANIATLLTLVAVLWALVRLHIHSAAESRRKCIGAAHAVDARADRFRLLSLRLDKVRDRIRQNGDNDDESDEKATDSRQSLKALDQRAREGLKEGVATRRKIKEIMVDAQVALKQPWSFFRAGDEFDEKMMRLRKLEPALEVVMNGLQEVVEEYRYLDEKAHLARSQLVMEGQEKIMKILSDIQGSVRELRERKVNRKDSIDGDLASSDWKLRTHEGEWLDL